MVLSKGLFPEEVMADFERFWMNPDTGYLGVHHIELHGLATSETGYYSHFFNDDELADENIEKYISDLVSEMSDLTVQSITKE